MQHFLPFLEKSWVRYRTSGLTNAVLGDLEREAVEQVGGRPSPLVVGEHLHHVVEPRGEVADAELGRRGRHVRHHALAHWLHHLRRERSTKVNDIAALD